MAIESMVVLVVLIGGIATFLYATTIFGHCVDVTGEWPTMPVIKIIINGDSERCLSCCKKPSK